MKANNSSFGPRNGMGNILKEVSQKVITKKDIENKGLAAMYYYSDAVQTVVNDYVDIPELMRDIAEIKNNNPEILAEYFRKIGVFNALILKTVFVTTGMFLISEDATGFEVQATDQRNGEKLNYEVQPLREFKVRIGKGGNLLEFSTPETGAFMFINHTGGRNQKTGEMFLDIEVAGLEGDLTFKAEKFSFIIDENGDFRDFLDGLGRVIVYHHITKSFQDELKRRERENNEKLN